MSLKVGRRFALAVNKLASRLYTGIKSHLGNGRGIFHTISLLDNMRDKLFTDRELIGRDYRLCYFYITWSRGLRPVVSLSWLRNHSAWRARSCMCMLMNECFFPCRHYILIFRVFENVRTRDLYTCTTIKEQPCQVKIEVSVGDRGFYRSVLSLLYVWSAYNHSHGVLYTS